MANVTVTVTEPNVTVNANTETVNVSTSVSNIIVSNTSSVSNTIIRAAFSVVDAGGDGSLTYAANTGVFTYTGPSASEVRAHLSNTAPILYDNSTGVISIDDAALFSGKTTDDLAEGATNKYYSSTLFDADFATKTTTDLTEGANLYYTDLRARDAVSLTVLTASGDGSMSYSNTTGVFTFTPADVPTSTDELPEGNSNLYYTDARVSSLLESGVGNIVANGTIFSGNTITANANVTAIEVKGNIEYVPHSGMPDFVINVDRGVFGDAYIMWDESEDKWMVNDTDNIFPIPANTSQLAEGATNLYFTSARADARIANALAGNVNVGGELFVAGNLEVTGNINYREVEDLLVQDQTITLNYGNASAQSAFIYVDRSGSALNNVHISWNETDDSWELYDGTITQGDIVFEGYTGNVTATNFVGQSGNAMFTAEVGTNIRLTTANNSVTPANLFIDTQNKGNIELRPGVGATVQGNHRVKLRGVMEANPYGGGGLGGITFKSGTSAQFLGNSYIAGGSGLLINSPEGDIQGNNISGINNVSATYFIGDGSPLTNITGANIVGEISTSSNITTTANVQADYFIADTEFIGDLDGAISTGVYNNTVSTLTKGKAVYLTGGNQGDQPHVDLADNTDPTKMPALGIVKENIGASTEGQVVTSGVINISAHGFTQGADLYINGSGDLTETIPTGEDQLIQKIGKVVSPNHIIVQGAFRTNATPNLDEGNIFLGSTSNTAVAVTPSSNFNTLNNAFELSNTLSNVNTITTEDNTGFTVNSRDGIVFNQEFSLTDTEVANISGDGFAFRNNNLYTNLLSYSGANAIVAYKFNGNITSGSNEITISAVNRYYDDAASAVSDLSEGMVYAEGTNFGSQPKGFARTAYVQSVDSANSKVIMSEVAQATLSVTDSTFWNAMIDTSTGQVIQVRSDYDNSGGSNTSVNNGLPINPDAYGYPSTGFSASDFDVISVGTSGDYSWDANIANFMVGRTAFAAEGTAPKFINGLVVGENTSLTNRAENDNLESFGVNVMWDGVSTAGYTSKIPQILMKSYTDNTLATVNNAINQSQKSLAGPRLFFSSADGNANDYAFGTYPKVNQELGRIAWWGSNAESLTPSSVYTPALISVLPHDNWETAGDSALDPAGNADMYFASTVDNTQGADVFMSYQGGKLTLASGKRADEDRHGIYFAPAEQNKKLMPKAIGLTYYEGNSKYWTKIGPANIAGDEGSQLTVTNGGDRGSTVGDLKMSIHRQNEPTLDFSVHGVFDAVLAGGGYGNVAITVPDEVSSYYTNLSTVTFSGTFEESATGSENALSGNTYRLYFITNVGGDIGYDVYLVFNTNYTPLTYAQLGGSTPYPASAPQVNYVDAPKVNVTNTQSGYSDKEWTLELNYPNDELNLKVDNNQMIEFSNVTTTFTNIPVMPSHSNTALPSAVAGGMIFVTNGNNKPAYSDGTSWYYYDNTVVT